MPAGTVDAALKNGISFYEGLQVECKRAWVVGRCHLALSCGDGS